MNVGRVSFGSLMLFKLNNDRSQTSIPEHVKRCFEYNSELKGYNLKDTVYCDKPQDLTVHNGARNFALSLDQKYKDKLHFHNKDVYLTEADFFIDPNNTKKRYFLTAASSSDENKIYQVLQAGNGNHFYTVKF